MVTTTAFIIRSTEMLSMLSAALVVVALSGCGVDVHVDSAAGGGTGADATIDEGASGGDAAAGPETQPADATGCLASTSTTACVNCCAALYPEGRKTAFFGNECLYCTDPCRNTEICRGATATSEINGRCLMCVQSSMARNCGGTAPPSCTSYLQCLKKCPTD